MEKSIKLLERWLRWRTSGSGVLSRVLLYDCGREDGEETRQSLDMACTDNQIISGIGAHATEKFSLRS